VSGDGFPYCIPLLYLWIDGELYLHTTSARGHLRANIEHNDRVCFEIDEQAGVFDYGRFECDSGLAYRSVCLFGRIRIVEDNDTRQRFCEALMDKYGKPETTRPKGFFRGSMPSPSMRSPSSASLARKRRCHRFRNSGRRRTARRHPTLPRLRIDLCWSPQYDKRSQVQLKRLCKPPARDATHRNAQWPRANIACGAAP